MDIHRPWFRAKIRYNPSWRQWRLDLHSDGRLVGIMDLPTWDRALRVALDWTGQ